MISLLHVRCVVASEHDVLNLLLRRAVRTFERSTLLYFQDVYDETAPTQMMGIGAVRIVEVRSMLVLIVGTTAFDRWR